MWQVVCTWAGIGGAPGTNTFLASTGDTDVDDLRTALAAFYTGFMTDQCSDDVAVTIPSAGSKIDSTTGQLSGLWASGTPTTVAGADTGNRVPDVAQILVQMHTDLVVNGRLLRGRVFIPGLRVTALTNGELSSGTITDVTASAEANLTGRVCVYSRTHKTFATVGACTTWNEMASLRSRRD